MLHYESYSGEDFVRKWTAMVGVRPDRELPAGPRQHRGRAARADRQGPRRGAGPRLPDASSSSAPPRTTSRRLRDLGLLVEVDPRQGTHRPADAPGRRRDAHAAPLLDELRAQPEAALPPARQAPPTPRPARRKVRAARRSPASVLTSSPSVDQARQAPRRAAPASAHAASSRCAGTAPVGVAHHAEQPAAALPVGAGPGLHRPGRPVVRRVAGRAPGARSRHRAGAAPRARRPCRPGRRAPSPPPTRWPRSRRRRAAAPRPARARPGSTDAAGNSTPATARASTRRTLVSSTTCRRP